MRHTATAISNCWLAIALGLLGASGLVVAFLGLAFGSADDLRSATSGISQNLSGPVEIEARGRHFHWSFRYPGQDQVLGTSDDLLVDKELHLPVGVEVELKLESDDYIYILYNAERGLKQIAVPELTHTLKLATETVETFDLRTDPLCGWRPLHDELMGRVVIQSATDFDAWFDESVSAQSSH